MINDKIKLALAALVFAGLASSPASSSRLVSGLAGQNIVNVNVSMNMQIPLADDDPETMSAAQVDGRKLLYRLATSECPILMETIAKTCRLNSLNVSSNVRHQNRQVPLMLQLNGNAQFAITLKGDDAPAQ